MFDHIPDRVFWPLFVLGWFVLSLAVGLLFGRIARWADSAPRFPGSDSVSEQHRRIALNGFKSRQGIR